MDCSNSDLQLVANTRCLTKEMFGHRPFLNGWGVCVCTHVGLGREMGSVCVVEAGSGGGLASVGSADETRRAVFAWESSGTRSLGVLSCACLGLHTPFFSFFFFLPPYPC